MLLLFLHFSENSILFDLDEVSTFLLTKTEPELFDTLTFFGTAGAPNLVSISLSFLDGTLLRSGL